MTTFQNVAIAGAGQLGRFIVSELNSSGFQVTILTRSKGNLKTVPPKVEAVEVDYSSVSDLAKALKGQDVIIGCLAMDAISAQYKLLEAAIQAGVKRYIPSEYSGITLDPGASKLPPLAMVMDVQNTVKAAAADGKIEYTIVAPGGFLNLMLNAPILLDWANHTVYLYDGGHSKVSISRLSTVAKAVRAVLEKGDAYKNQVVKVHDGFVTQRQVLGIAKEERPDTVWKEIEVDVNTLVDDGLKKISEGNGTPEVVGSVMVAKSMAKDAHFCWAQDELENSVLGIEGLTNEHLEALIRKRARGEMVDMPNEHEGAWKIDIK